MADLGIYEKEELRLLRIANDLELKLRKLSPDSEEWAALKLEAEEASLKWREYHERRVSSDFSNIQEPLLHISEPPDELYITPTVQHDPSKSSTIRIVAASIVGVLIFFAISILLGMLIVTIVALLMQIKIIEIAIRFFVTLPVSNGWYINEETALYAVIGVFAYSFAYFISEAVMDRISRDNPIPLLVAGIALLVIGIPSAIMAIIIKSTIWADIYCIIAGICFVKKSWKRSAL